MGDLFAPVKVRSYATAGLHLKPDQLDELPGRVGAFGDFDSDLFTDLVWIHDESAEPQQVSVLRWNREADTFVADPMASAKIPAAIASSAARLTLSVVPSDLNLDGKMDLLVVCTEISSGNSTLLLYFGGRGGQSANPTEESNELMLSARPLFVGRAVGQVLLMDANGDRRPDLFGEAAGLAEPDVGEQTVVAGRHFWLNNLTSSPATCFNGVVDGDEELVDCGGGCYACHCFLDASALSGSVSGCGFAVHGVHPGVDRARTTLLGRLSRTRAHGFADINGDCLSDLLVASVAGGDAQYEVWLNGGSDGVRPNFLAPSSENLILAQEPGAGSVSVLDFNRDGSLDLMYAVSSGCQGAVLRDESTASVGAWGSRGTRDRGGMPFGTEDGLASDGFAPCSTSKVYVALNARSDIRRNPSELCTSSPEDDVTFGRQGVGGSGRSRKGRLAEVVADTQDFGGASLFGGAEPVPHHRGESGKPAPLMAEGLGMDPRMLHIADMDLDGYPDVVVAARDKDAEARLLVFRNTPVSGKASARWSWGWEWLRRGIGRLRVARFGQMVSRSVGSESEAGVVGMGGRRLVKMSCEPPGKGTGDQRSEVCDLPDLLHITGVYGAGFVDLYGQGNHDVVLLHTDDSGNFRGKVLASNLNSKRNLFLKVQGLNGVCPEWCDGGEKFPDPKPFGVNYPGVSLKYIMQDLSNEKLASQAAQLPHSSHGALAAPYALFGLGPVSYYIENLYFGMPLAIRAAAQTEVGGAGDVTAEMGKEVFLSKHYMNWMGSIPNSQLVASPTDPSNPANWWLQSYVLPSEGVMQMVLVMGATILVLGASIWILERRERYQDAMETQLTAHAFL